MSKIISGKDPMAGWCWRNDRAFLAQLLWFLVGGGLYPCGVFS